MRRWSVRQWSLWTHRPRTVLLVLGIEVATLAWTASLVGAESGSAEVGGVAEAVVAVALVALAIAQAEFDVFALRTRRMVFAHSHGFDFLAVWTFGAPLVLSPQYYVPLVAIVHLHSWWRITRVRKPLHRTLLTLATVVLAAHSAHLIVEMLGNGSPTSVEMGVPVLIPAMLAYALVNQLTVAAVIKSADPTVDLATLWGTGEDYLMELVTLCMGAMTGAVVSVAAPLLVFVPGPLLLLQRAVVFRQLSEAVERDQKTGLLTVAAWRSRAERLLDGPPPKEVPSWRALGRARSRASALAPVGVLMCDLDHFKRINDDHGHLVGDVVLRRVAETLRAGTGSDGLVARFGGEEFLVLVVASPEEAARGSAALAEVGEALRGLVSAIELSVDTADGPVTLGRLTISIGAAALHPARRGAGVDALVAAADAAVYVAKRSGRDRVTLAD